MITVMGDNITQSDSEHHACITEQLELVRRWLVALEGSNRYRAFELMQRVMAVEITNQEAFELLEYK